MRAVIACLLLVASVAGCAPAGEEARQEQRVERVADGDTIELGDGSRVRLVQIDATELRDDECYARAAAAQLRALLPPGTRVTLERDPSLDDVDRYGRLLRYVVRDGLNVNVELVRRGAAAPYFHHGDRGRYARDLQDAAEAARRDGRGMWGSCRVAWNPERQAEATYR